MVIASPMYNRGMHNASYAREIAAVLSLARERLGKAHRREITIISNNQILAQCDDYTDICFMCVGSTIKSLDKLINMI